jgi:Flp pilus assembly protein TadB
MRSLKAWWWRIAVAVGLALTAVSLDQFVWHTRPLVVDLFEWVGIIGLMLLFRYLDARKRRRPPTTAKQQLPEAGEQHASGG